MSKIWSLFYIFCKLIRKYLSRVRPEFSHKSSLIHFMNSINNLFAPHNFVSLIWFTRRITSADAHWRENIISPNLANHYFEG